MKLPFDMERTVPEGNFSRKKQFVQVVFVTGKIAEGGRIFKGEFQRFGSIVETDEAETSGNLAGGAEDGNRIGGGAKTDVPDNKFAGGFREAFRDVELADVKKIGLGLRAKARVHFFTVTGGEKSALSIGEGYELVVIGHGGIVKEKPLG